MSIVTVDAKDGERGANGEIALASGASMSMRLWSAEEPHAKQAHRSEHETLGYVISGRAEMTIEGQTTMLMPGVSYLVPAHAEHTYRILDTFTAVECTCLPDTHSSGEGRGS